MVALPTSGTTGTASLPPLCGARRGSAETVGEAGVPRCKSVTLGELVRVSFVSAPLCGVQGCGGRGVAGALCTVCRLILTATLIPLVRTRLREVPSPVPGHAASRRQRGDEPVLHSVQACAPPPPRGTVSLHRIHSLPGTLAGGWVMLAPL